MIRKDILPDVWTDGWRCEAPAERITVRRGEAMQLVLCQRQDVPMFMLREGEGYVTMDDLCRADIAMEEGSSLKLYRLQGMSTPARHLTQLDITMQRDAQLEMCTVTLGGGHVRNNVVVRMQGEGCSCKADGLYLIDREQECDNYIFVEHAKPHCTSSELYKGIMDDAARARFNGHVLVQDGAVKTEAYMTNRNMLLTDLQTRGISERTALTMLSYAFCDEVIRGIAIGSLRDAVGDMVKKRLHGELSPSCDECALRCTTPCNGESANFRIDPSKL